MTKVSIYDPFADVFPTLFRGFFTEAEPGQRSAPSNTGTGQQAVPMRVDVIESDSGYIVRADLPGVPKEAVQVDIDGHRVSIRAEIKREAVQKEGERVLRSERYAGAFARSFSLTDEIDDERAQARLDNGVLELSLPKKAVTGARRLAIA